MIISHSARDRAPISIALTGANGGYGRTFLAQLSSTPEIRPAVLVDPDIDGLRDMLAELGIAPQDAVVAQHPEDARRISDSGAIVLAAGMAALDWSSIDVLVEACGHVGHGSAYAQTALENDTHVVMVSKEVDTVAGVELNALAARKGLSYLPGDGDQPANLLRLLDWVAAVGLDIVAIGKAGEYDLCFDPTTGYVEQAGELLHAPELGELLELDKDVVGLLERRAQAVAQLKRSAAADACEMTVVGLRTGFAADVETMHYPVARINELADIYAMEKDGGLLRQEGVLEVFSALRLPGEASFAGGVFAIVRTGDPVTWEILRGKGHVISRDGRYACIYWPYHYMGVETALTVHAAMDRRSVPAAKPGILLAARASEDLPAGTSLAVAGHHHEITGVAPVMVAPTPGAAPFYLLDGTTLTRSIAAGELIALDDVSGIDPRALQLYLSGASITETTKNGVTQ